MNQLEVFQNAEFGSVRVVVEDGVPYFVGKDVADVLGYSNSRKALLDHVDEKDKDGVTIRDAIGRDQNAVVINESGLYSLILSSKMPNAKKFKRWVTNEVLPSIRQHGVFATDSFIKKSIEDPAWSISVLKELQAKNEQIAIQAQQISELQPKANYYDVVLNCKDLVTISVIAKDYGWTAIQMNKYLNKKKVQFKQGQIWLLYKEYASFGYTSTKTHHHKGKDGTDHTSVHTYWSQSGRLFIYNLLKNDGILPMIERGDDNA
ncbi:phage antirepressor [Enterococcus faecium]|uniref:phage antirepressor n=1 Tax=Enterococcus faecium TaxID=1352 RepID=UPI00115EC92C|nr:phage antirepressor [Enterococcus faecium]